MAKQKHKPNANELWLYFHSVDDFPPRVIGDTGVPATDQRRLSPTHDRSKLCGPTGA